ncbi:hypothetical protein [Dokdonella fugitiva]|jgi:hypothetical protein|uniref:YjbR protein n=1 Tax=Dokdonella fugitiva TaxID=328517 RepID=A0A4R2ICV5_9GAMM|nr:hypothetical protein [Dokdonella fugitiva]TCO41972.1 YjbR protein [Dokdonella fugitiva]
MGAMKRFHGGRQAALPPQPVLANLRKICAGLPESCEENAWVGVRWRVRQKTFAHVLMLDEGWPPAYAEASGLQGPACLITFRTVEKAFQPERFNAPPFFRPKWFPDIMGLELDDPIDWADVSELVRRSYLHLAPRKLAAMAC